MLEKNIEGSFMLQPQSCLTKPSPLKTEFDEKFSTIEETFQQIQDGTDESTLLKYLELSSFKSCPNSEGRTPFTITKTISKQADGTFGFEISWTKPPKINSVKENLEKYGLNKGDFIIFVGDTNIVTRPKMEIIELIRKHDGCLVLEIFRPVEKLNSKEIIDMLAAQSTPVAGLTLNSLKRTADSISDTPKSRKSCHFKQPKICFQPTVGSGVIV